MIAIVQKSARTGRRALPEAVAGRTVSSKTGPKLKVSNVKSKQSSRCRTAADHLQRSRFAALEKGANA